MVGTVIVGGFVILVATGCTPATSALLASQRYGEVCALSAADPISTDDNRRIADALAEEVELSLDGRILSAAEVEERWGMAPATELRFIELHWHARTSRFGGAVAVTASVARDGVPAPGGRIRYRSLSILDAQTVFPMPESLGSLPLPETHRRQTYQPTPAPELQYTRGRRPNALEAGASGVASALTLGFVRPHAGFSGTLTPRSRRARARWESENEEPRRLWELEQDRLGRQNVDERGRVGARNEELRGEREGFVLRRHEVIAEIEETHCDATPFAERCAEAYVIADYQVALPTRLSVVAKVTFPDNGCSMSVYYQGDVGDSVGAALTATLRASSVSQGRR
ncbi:MAG: hypothetical protein DRJ42_25055 [Deltaproteobacteria bacterium]|nr:MAG: hypothetical protein DRJ42_25055 [Deltaproteobacteria bacterium]